jgi:hypothetical protein
MGVCVCNSKLKFPQCCHYYSSFPNVVIFFLSLQNVCYYCCQKEVSSRKENNSLQLQSLVLQPWKKLLPWSKEEKSEAFSESLVLSAWDCMVQALDSATVFSELHNKQGNQKPFEGNFGDSVGRNSVAGLLHNFSAERSQACLHQDWAKTLKLKLSQSRGWWSSQKVQSFLGKWI